MKKREPWEERMDAFEARMRAVWEATEKDRHSAEKLHRERMERIDQNLAATSKLLRYGAKLLIQVQESQKQLVENLVNPRNGHKGKKSL